MQLDLCLLLISPCCRKTWNWKLHILFLDRRDPISCDIDESWMLTYGNAENRPNTSQLANAINTGRGLPWFFWQKLWLRYRLDHAWLIALWIAFFLIDFSLSSLIHKNLPYRDYIAHLTNGAGEHIATYSCIYPLAHISVCMRVCAGQLRTTSVNIIIILALNKIFRLEVNNLMHRHEVKKRIGWQCGFLPTNEKFLILCNQHRWMPLTDIDQRLSFGADITLSSVVVLFPYANFSWIPPQIPSPPLVRAAGVMITFFFIFFSSFFSFIYINLPYFFFFFFFFSFLLLS